MSVRVLIVDDDVPTRVGLHAILSSDDRIEVVGEATTGEEACSMALELAPDVVLMDVRLPDIDGIEAMRRILAASDGETPRVLVLTTFNVDEYVYRSLQSGASGFLLKRTRADDIIDSVLVVADGNTLPAPAAMRALIDAHAGADARRTAQVIASLTPRERDVLVLIARGFSNREIADELIVSLETVRTHVKHVYAKCGARDRAQAVIAAYESGLMTPWRSSPGAGSGPPRRST